RFAYGVLAIPIWLPLLLVTAATLLAFYRDLPRAWWRCGPVSWLAGSAIRASMALVFIMSVAVLAAAPLCRGGRLGARVIPLGAAQWVVVDMQGGQLRASYSRLRTLSDAELFVE